MGPEWRRILDLAVARGLLTPEAARALEDTLTPGLTIAEFAARTGLSASIVEDLDREAAEAAPSTLVIARAPASPSTAVAALAQDMLTPTTSRSSPAPPPPLLRRVGRYEILERIGGGAMGTVYRAFDPTLGRAVALKTLRHAEDETDPEWVERFVREARAAGRLRHPGLLPVHELGEADGLHYFTMDIVDGKSFRQALRDGSLQTHAAAPAPDAPTVVHGMNPHSAIRTPQSPPPRLPLRVGIDVLAQAAEALGFAHAQGVVHRDVKPENILLDRDGHPFVSDFGLAKDLSGGTGATKSGVGMGTPQYMSPEQWEDAKHATPASDVFALGVILYEILTGQRPFESNLCHELARRVREEDPPPPSRIEASVPRDLETVCLKCLAKAPARRYPTARELAEDLRRYLAGELVLARRPSAVERLARKAVRHKAASIAAIVAFTAAFVAVGGLWHRSRAARAADRAASLLERALSEEEPGARARAVEEAIQAIEGAMALDPSNARVQAGLTRARTEAHLAAGREARGAEDASRALAEYTEALRLDASNPKARDGTSWATDELGWCDAYLGPIDGETLASRWLPSPGVEQQWETDGHELVAEATSHDGLLTLVMRLPRDVRIDYDVLQETSPLGDFGCTLASDLRGWEVIDPAPRAAGLFVGIGSEDNPAVMKVLSSAMGEYKRLYRNEAPGPIEGPQVWHHVRVERREVRLRAWVGAVGAPLAQVIDLNLPSSIADATEEGYFGLYKYHGRYRYRRVRVRTRERDPRGFVLRGEVDRAFLEFNQGEYASHQARLGGLLAELESPPQAAVREEVKNRVRAACRLLALADADPGVVAEEAMMSLRLWANENPGFGVNPRLLDARARERLWGDMEEREKDPALSEGMRSMFELLRVESLIDAGRYDEALGRLGSDAVGLLPPGSEDSFRRACLVGKGDWKTAIDLPDPPGANHDEWRRLLEADRWREIPEERRLADVVALRAAPTLVYPFHVARALCLASRTGEAPPAWAFVDKDGTSTWGEAWAFALAGLLAGWNGDRAAMLKTWSDLAPADEPVPLDVAHPRLGDDIERVSRVLEFQERNLVRVLAGRGDGGLAERWRRLQEPEPRIWLDLALAIRAEEDGDPVNGRRLYECVKQDDVGLLLPMEWADAGLRRLR